MNTRIPAPRFRAVLFLAVALWTLTGVTRLYAQATDGNLVGTVVDQSGAAVPNANVEITNTATNVTSKTVTNASGEYRFNNILVGNYDLKVTHTGFSTATLRNINVSLNQTATQNVTLQVGSVETTIEVTETPAIIDTTTAQVQSTFEQREAIDTPSSALPLGVLNLSLLGAGVANPGGIGLGDGPSVGGQRPRNNSFNVEGVTNDRRDVTGHNIDIPSEAVSEFTMLQNQFSAEFGSGTGGQFNTVIRSGTNNFHGALFEYFQNRNLNAVDQSNARQGLTSNPRYDQNTFGASLGGPFIKNKLFFYGLWQYNPTGQSAPPGNPIFAPTAAGYSILSSIAGISQTNLGVLKKYLPPAPTGDQGTISVLGRAIPIGTVPINPPSYLNIETYLASIDYNISNSDQLRGRFINELHDGFDPSALAPLPAFYISRPTTQKLLSLSEIHNFSPTLLNEFRFGYSRYNDLISAGDFTFPGLDTFPNLTIDDLNSTQLGPYSTSPQSVVLNSYQLIDNLNWTKGRHTFKFGWEGRKYITATNFIQRLRGDYEYSTLELYLLDGSPDVIAERNVGAALYYGNAINNSLYANDQFRLRPNLTLNIGLRWDYQGIPASDKQQALNSLSSVPGVLEFRAPTAQLSAFSPRFGIAYSPGTSGKTSIRAGFGWFYDKIFENLSTNSRPPQVSSTVDIPPGQPNFLANGGIKPNVPGTPVCNSVESCRAATSSYIYDQNLPYSLNWNVGVQHVFGNDYTLEVRYLGTKGVHLFTQSRINSIPKITPSLYLPTYLQMPSLATLAALPVTLGDINARSNHYTSLYPGFTSFITAFPNRGNSEYHGLAVEFTRRFARNLLFKGAYTWSHNIDDSTADLFSTLLSPRRPQDFQNMTPEKSDSFLDRRHRFTFNWVWDTPWFNHSDNKFARYALGGYIFSGTYTFESPQYATVQSPIDSNLNGDAFADRSIVNPNGTPGVGSDVVGLTRTGARISSGGTVTAARAPIVAYLALNPNAQYIVAGLGALATGGRQTMALGRINNWDIQVKKAFNFTESMKFEVAAQAFNLFNHPQYVSGYINNVQFHNSNTTRDNLLPNDPAFNRPDLEYNSNSRVMQLTARFQF
jgi:hypothetical protein